ncbi:unnamed protein product [Durusdinium trenchii]|uniref:Uncharacterized protein n=1 Tax=Durusdinium trenchii TaxID=1381693 RepID=A0ABP0N9M0_9DINO
MSRFASRSRFQCKPEAKTSQVGPHGVSAPIYTTPRWFDTTLVGELVTRPAEWWAASSASSMFDTPNGAHLRSFPQHQEPVQRGLGQGRYAWKREAFSEYVAKWEFAM